MFFSQQNTLDTFFFLPSGKQIPSADNITKPCYHLFILPIFPTKIFIENPGPARYLIKVWLPTGT